MEVSDPTVSVAICCSDALFKYVFDLSIALASFRATCTAASLIRVEVAVRAKIVAASKRQITIDTVAIATSTTPSSSPRRFLHFVSGSSFNSK